MTRICAALFALTLLSGCATTPILKSETIPVYSGKLPATVAVAVVDHRPFILNGNKEEWFEGIALGWGVLGYALTATRVDEFKNKPFAFYLATKLKDSFDGAGAKASIIQIPKGTPFAKVIEIMKKSKVGVGLVVMMFQSRFYFGPFNHEYGYNFELIVLDSSGKPLDRKTFKGMDQNIELSTKYGWFDMMSEIYKNKFDAFLNDPKIKSALTAAAAGS